MPVKDFPALAAAFVQTVVAVLAGFGLFRLSAAWVGSGEALVAALAGLWVASKVHAGFIPAAIGAVNAGITLLIAFKVPHISVTTVSLVDAAIMAGLALFVHAASTPRTKPAPVTASREPQRL